MSYKVSVIIPVYNVENYLEQCLDSVINQTLKDIEIILVDDGSTDSSLSICNEYAQKDSRITVLTQQNKGAGAARNMGLERATGEYLSILDSDDYFELNMLEKMYNKAQSTEADIVVCDVNHFDNALMEIKYIEAINKSVIPKKEVFNYKDFPNYIFNCFQNWTWNKLFKREFIQKNNIQFQEIQRTNDLYFTCCALVLAARISYLDERMVCYRIGTTSNAQSTNYKAPTDFAKAFIKLKDFLEQKNIYNEVKSSYINWAVSGCLYNLHTLYNYPKSYKKLRNYLIDTGFKQMDITEENQKLFYSEYEYNEFMKIYKPEPHYNNAFQRIFSIKNSYDKKHKIITILGMKIKIKGGKN